MALRPFPKIMTAEGDPFIFGKVLFDVVDRSSVTKSLAGCPGLVDHSDGSYGCVEKAGHSSAAWAHSQWKGIA